MYEIRSTTCPFSQFRLDVKTLRFNHSHISRSSTSSVPSFTFPALFLRLPVGRNLFLFISDLCVSFYADTQKDVNGAKVEQVQLKFGRLSNRILRKLGKFFVNSERHMGF